MRGPDERKALITRVQKSLIASVRTSGVSPKKMVHLEEGVDIMKSVFKVA